MDLHVLRWPEHDLTISGKLLPICACDKNFVISIDQELTNVISWNIIFSVIQT